MSYTCSVCEVEITLKEKEYSIKKYNAELCRDHQSEATSVETIQEIQSDEVGSENENPWVGNVIKGRIAETIVEQLFYSLGFQVYKYGMENTIPGIADLLTGIKDDVAMNIRRMPDFVVFKDNRAHFIEVKFRANGKFKLSDIDKNSDYPYHNALIVHLSKKHIKCISYQELVEGKEITPTCRNYLGSRKEFDTDKEKIIEYCKYAVKYFENV